MKQILYALLALFIVSWSADAFAFRTYTYSGGAGTSDSPYLIGDKADLQYLSENSSEWSYHFKQTADIAFTADDFAAGGDFYNSGAGFSPISFTAPFTGSYDGDGHTIDNLFINRSSSDYVGLFGLANAGVTIKNLGVTNVNIHGKGSTAGLAGYFISGAVVVNCYVTGEVTGSGSNVGGLIGFAGGGSYLHVQDSYATCKVTSSGSNVGGLVGFSQKDSISNCYATGEVSGVGYVGGLIGYANADTISDCHATGKVSGSGNYAGGLVGMATINSIISDCHATGEVSGVGYVGGLVGQLVTGCGISKSYATGKVSGSGDYAGGFIGYVSEASVVSNCYATGGASTNGNYAGGLIGNAPHASTSVSNCYAMGKVSAVVYYAGGLNGFNGASVSNCYAANNVSGGDYVGGITGVNTGTVQKTYWNTDSIATGIQAATTSGPEGKTTSEMKQAGTYADWDFTNTWGIDAAKNDGYPYLQWQTFEASAPAEYTGPSNDGNSDHLKVVVNGASGLTLNFVFHDDAPAAGVLPAGIARVSQYRWVIEKTAGTFSDAKIRVPVADLAGVVNKNKLTWLKRSTPGSGAWTNIGGTIVNDTLVSDAFSSFSEFVIGDSTSGDSPLPVELTSFNGASTNAGVVLNWKTAAETDNAGFVLYRNGAEIASYQNTNALEGQGTTSNETDYSYTDAEVFIGETYTYKLTSIDNSGEIHEYSQTFSVSVTETVAETSKPNEYALEQNYPNPFNPSTTITFSLKQAGLVTFQVFDILGRVIHKQVLNGNAGENTPISFDARGLNSGVYFYRIQSGAFSSTKKMILLK
ncbi:hypothetical protein Ctha_1540 [Chloroherpeton thalassium ATCC 35110]|uniref:GLUG domain protein n=1 Tax=Chloroherpeton thalassium (strain ATCC 35110 / GB-78) TaxID=517418 RepID=B3QS54_CHLT3|nr:T9SS type A sorting domain-containing protein [Chloroherpeton thalassium]ACF13999.1 hypothetical protein Ctha_1540 [Chloroherpeton thalassium ATCC 35110]